MLELGGARQGPSLGLEILLQRLLLRFKHSCCDLLRPARAARRSLRDPGRWYFFFFFFFFVSAMFFLRPTARHATFRFGALIAQVVGKVDIDVRSDWRFCSKN